VKRGGKIKTIFENITAPVRGKGSEGEVKEEKSKNRGIVVLGERECEGGGNKRSGVKAYSYP